MSSRSIQSTPQTLLIITGSLILCGIFGAVTASILMVMPNNIINQLVVSIVGMCIMITLGAYAIAKSHVLAHLGSLRWLMALLILFTVSTIILNLWVFSQIIFIDTYYLGLMGVILVFAALTALGTGYFIARTLIDRLMYVCRAAEDVANGNLDSRLTIRGNDEIAQLARAFDDMTRQLKAADEQKRNLEQTRRNLVAWVSHDLRTPLTSMRVMMEALADGVITDEDTRQRYLTSSLAEIEHLSHLIDDLFELAQLDVGHLRLNYQPVPVRELLSDTIGTMTAKAKQHSLNLAGNVDPDIDLVSIAPDKIQRVLKNLIENAIRYTPAGETVTIRAHRNDTDTVQIDVHNSGVYVESDTLPTLFESFYRGDSSRARNADESRGVGLGLAIARGFVQAHGGRIWATSTPQDGTTFSFTLPDNPAPEDPPLLNSAARTGDPQH